MLGFYKLLRQPLVSNASFLILVSLVNSSAGFAFWGLAARLYSAKDVGIASSIISAALIIAGIADLGLSTGLGRFLPEAKASTRLLTTSFLFTCAASLIAGLIFLSGLKFWTPSLIFLVKAPWYSTGFLAFCTASVIASILNSVFVARRQARFAFFQSGAVNLSRLTLVLLLTGWGAIGLASSVFLAMAIAMVISFMLFLPLVEPGFRRLRLDFSCGDLFSIFPYSIANYLVSIFTQTSQRMLPLIVLSALGPASNGHFYVAWMIGDFLATPGSAIAASAFAEGSNFPQDLPIHLKRSVWIGLCLTLPGALAAGLAPSYLLSFFGPGYAAEASGLLQWLALAAPLTALTRLYFTRLRVQKQVGKLVLFSAMMAGITLGISTGMISRFGIGMVGLGWLIGNCSMALFALLDVMNQPRIETLTQST